MNGTPASHMTLGILQRSGLIVDFDAGVALYRSGVSLCSLEQSERAQALRLVQEAIDEAYVLGAARLSLISGRDPGVRLGAGMTGRAMRIAIVGGGAMGSIYASLLARSPHEVWLVDIWREHVEAIRHHLQQLRAGSVPDFLDALRSRIFTELGNGVLDVLGVVRELALLDYTGWIMCEQDTTWRQPAESAAISRAVLGYAIRLIDDLPFTGYSRAPA